VTSGTQVLGRDGEWYSDSQGTGAWSGTGGDGLVGMPAVLGLRRPAVGVMHGAKGGTESLDSSESTKGRKCEFCT
jgi:hypothetical protein